MNEKRLVVAVFGVLVAVLVGYLAVQFIAALSVAVFLYYSTRRYHHGLQRFRLPERARAAITLASLAIPLLLLISYTVVLLAVETRQFIAQYPVMDVVSRQVPWLEVTNIPELTLHGLYRTYQSGDFDPFVQFATENATFLISLVSGFFLNLFVTIVVTYYLLVDGGRIRSWLERFDEDDVIRQYLEAVDRELEAVLFGNLLNVIAVSLIAIVAYHGYNAVVPAAAEVPYPTLAGALTGIGSLIPVVGMKIVYVPLAGIVAIPILLDGTSGILVYVVSFLVVTVVLVDIVPDLILRPLLSGDTTHVGLLMLAYTLGPVVLGFYGLFFAPILLVVFFTFADTALPLLLRADETDGVHPDQTRLNRF